MAVQHDIVEGATRPIWKLKRILDVVLACAVMIAIAPAAVIVAVLVLIDVGHPVVFWQHRMGRLGRPLRIYKFRTMKAAFDKRGYAVPEEQRISWIGHHLRAKRLDEIPQLWNILTGDMSVVGPRPLLPADQPKGFSVRLQVRPGLTGLAQVSGGRDITVEEKDAIDEHYVKHVSVCLDLKIMLLTACVMVLGDRRNEALIATALAEKHEHDGPGRALPQAQCSSFRTLRTKLTISKTRVATQTIPV
jgi:lipopolysaccharide/colanic/teichoic acid biosynthesis glycosyltransferase